MGAVASRFSRRRVVTAIVGGFAVESLIALAGQLVRLSVFGKLRDQVAYSSRMIAAARAAETEREDALFRDKFAATLAGPQAIKKREQRAQRGSAHASTDVAPTDSSGKRKVNNIVCRTKFLDDLILELTRSSQETPPQATAAAHFSNIRTRTGAGVGSDSGIFPGQFSQVVLVGAGMDSRAWRLPVGRHVGWFEIDQKRVLDTKLKLLADMGAQTCHKNDDGSFTDHLQCSTYHPVALNVKDASLPAALADTEFDRSKPTLWVLEGLTYYLSADANQLLFQSMAALSAPGSVFAASMAPRTLIERNKDRKSGGLMALWQWGFPANFAEVAAGWGWDILDAIDYVSIAGLYGCEYAAFRTAGTSELQPPQGSATGLDFSGDYVRIITASLRPM